MFWKESKLFKQIFRICDASFCFDPVTLEFYKKYCCIIGPDQQVLGARLRGTGVFRRAAPSIFKLITCLKQKLLQLCSCQNGKSSFAKSLSKSSGGIVPLSVYNPRTNFGTPEYIGGGSFPGCLLSVFYSPRHRTTGKRTKTREKMKVPGKRLFGWCSPVC